MRIWRPHGIPNLRSAVPTLIVMILACQVAGGAIITDFKPYEVTHVVDLRPAPNVRAVLPVVTANYFEHAWVLDPALRSSTNPAAQPVGFAAGGFESLDRRGRVTNSSRNGTNNGPVNTGAIPVPAGGIGPTPPGMAFPAGAVTQTANVAAPTNRAQGNSRFRVDPFGVNTPITGFMRVDGFAEANYDTATKAPQPSEAYAFSSAEVTAQGRIDLGKGAINWNPLLRTPPLAGGAIAGPFNVRRVRDPIYFTATDLVTNQTIEDTLLDITFDIFGAGSMSWDSSAGLFEIDAANAEFHIDISSPYTVQQGTLDLVIRSGVVFASSDSGMFDGLLPAIGTPGSFSLPLGTITLDYDLGDFGGHDADITFGFAGSGSAFAHVIPEPGTIVLCVAALALGLAARKHWAMK